MHDSDIFISASTTTHRNPLDFSHIKNTEFGIKFRDRNIFYFCILEDKELKGLLLMIGEKTLLDWNNVDEKLKDKFIRWITKRGKG